MEARGGALEAAAPVRVGAVAAGAADARAAAVDAFFDVEVEDCECMRDVVVDAVGARRARGARAVAARAVSLRADALLVGLLPLGPGGWCR